MVIKMIEIIGKRIKELRKNNGFSQEKLAQKLDVTTGAVCKWEIGLTYPDIDTLLEIAKLFEVSVDYLLGNKVNGQVAEEITKSLTEAIETKKFTCEENEIANYIKKHENDFEVNYYFGKYLYIKEIEENNRNTIKPLPYLLKAQNLLKTNTYDYTEEKVAQFNTDILYTIISIYIDNKKSDEAIKLINSLHDLSRKDLLLGQCYLMDKKLDLAKEHLSNNLIISLTNLINGAMATCLILIKEKNYQEGLDYIDWLLMIYGNISKTSNSFFTLVTGYIYLYRAIFDYLMKNNYMKDLQISLDLEDEYYNNPNFQTNSIKFYYGNNVNLYGGMNLKHKEESIIEAIENNGELKGFLEIYLKQVNKRKNKK